MVEDKVPNPERRVVMANYVHMYVKIKTHILPSEQPNRKLWHHTGPLMTHVSLFNFGYLRQPTGIRLKFERLQCKVIFCLFTN